MCSAVTEEPENRLGVPARRPARSHPDARRRHEGLSRFYKGAVSALFMIFTAAFAPALLAQEAPGAPANHGGGEANLVLPDLSQVSFLGMNGHSLLMLGLIVCGLGILS
jgi:K(+)-stimulated pyrophosphate-energized sodium pump